MQKSLGLSLTDIGIITSVFPSVYGVAKLFGGVVADVNSPRVVFSGGLMAIAACNALFALGGSVPYFAFFWAANGIVSSIGFPACARMLSSWFSSTERGFYWGILNVSLNIGGFISPILVGSAASAFGWRFGMIGPASIAAICGICSYLAIRDTPADAGLVRRPESDKSNSIKHDGTSNKFTSAVATFRRQLIDGVLTVPPVWNLAMGYFFVYIIRQALTSWTIFYFLDAKGVASVAEAALRVSGLELGGFIGSVSSGWLSDKLIQSNNSAGAVGQRVKVAILYLGITAFMLIAFYFVPVTAALLPFQWLVFAALGAGLYGPQLLIGLSGAECVAPSCAGTSNGFLGTAAYTGAALAGLPLTFVVRHLGWNAFFGVLLACCVSTAAVIMPLTTTRSFEQDHPTLRTS
jgi:MFS transporter, OPA family, sugar phosphate sensor protein UhpC